MITICCIKQGTKYGSEYVNKLYNMVQRNVHLTAYNFVCLTENTEGVDRRIRTAPLPCNHPGWWQKVGLFQKSIPGISTNRILFLDLDVVITGNLDPLFTMPGDFIVCKDWPEEIKPGNQDINTSAFILQVGAFPQVWETFEDKFRALYPTDQEYIQSRIPSDKRNLFPYDLTPSYKLRKLYKECPRAAKIVLFHGEPKPPECGGWVKQYWQ